MMLSLEGVRVFLALGPTDMRKSINGLSALVRHFMGMNPLSGHLFVFTNRQKNMVKILYWDRNGFCLWHKRLERDRFTWPESEKEVISISQRELMWLMDGLDIRQITAHQRLHYTQIC
jgi:transposase